MRSQLKQQKQRHSEDVHAVTGMLSHKTYFMAAVRTRR